MSAKKKIVFNFAFNGKLIPSRLLKEIWQSNFSDKPFPNVLAYELEYHEFMKTINAYEESDTESKKLGEKAELREYGRLLPLQEITAKLIPVDEAKTKLLILRRPNSTYSLKEDLTHELEHIYNDDLSKPLE